MEEEDNNNVDSDIELVEMEKIKEKELMNRIVKKLEIKEKLCNIKVITTQVLEAMINKLVFD